MCVCVGVRRMIVEHILDEDQSGNFVNFALKLTFQQFISTQNLLI